MSTYEVHSTGNVTYTDSAAEHAAADAYMNELAATAGDDTLTLDEWLATRRIEQTLTETPTEDDFEQEIDPLDLNWLLAVTHEDHKWHHVFAGR